MTKLNRVTGKIFGETASPIDDPILGPAIGQFGSAKAGTYLGTDDIATIQSLPAWSNGWIDAVTPTNQYPALPERTGVDKVLSYQENYILQRGVPEWDENTDYYENCFCSYNGSIYRSIADDNTGNQPDDEDYWELYGAIDDYANQSLTNLTALGNARLQFAPFAINQGTVLNGENNTLTYSGPTITCDPCTITTCDGRTAIDSNTQTYTLSGNIEYKKYNFTEVGTLEKYQGAIGGFTTANYGTLPNRFQTAVANGETWEVVGAFMTSSFKSGQMLFTDGVASGQAGYTGFMIEVLSSGRLEVAFDWSGSSQAQGVGGTTPIQLNRKYWYKVTFDGSKYEAFISNNSIEWTKFFNYASTASIVSSGNATYLGIVNRGGLIYPATYTNIYLNDSYIKINGSSWWTGTLDGTSSDYDYSVGDNDGNYCILKDYSTGKLSLADNIYIGKNAFEYINLTNEGTAIASGTASGYSLASAFDNNISTRWASSQKGAAVPNAAYIGRSGLSKPIKKIMLYQGLKGYTTNYCDEIKIQYSDDGTTWNDIQTVTNCLNNEWQEIIVDNYTPSDTTHSIRLLAYSSPEITGASAWAVDELELYAKNVFNNRLDISTVPANLYIGGILNNNLVYIGDCTISSGVITAIKNNQFNMNGYWELFNLPDYSSKISLTSGTLYTAETNGWILNGNTIVQTLYKGDSYTPSANGYYFARMRGY